MMAETLLHVPVDAQEAWEAWKCSCGPAALAALLGRSCEGVRNLFPYFPKKDWVNPTGMRQALHLSGVKFRTVPGTLTRGRGLVFIGIEGPWTAPGVPIAAAYRHTHWIAAARQGRGWLVYDVNNEGVLPGSGWLPRAEWVEKVMSRIVSSHAGARGWRVRSSIEVQDG